MFFFFQYNLIVVSAPLLHNPLNLLSYRGYNKWPSTYVSLGSNEVKIIFKKN